MRVGSVDFIMAKESSMIYVLDRGRGWGLGSRLGLTHRSVRRSTGGRGGKRGRVGGVWGGCEV